MTLPSRPVRHASRPLGRTAALALTTALLPVWVAAQATPAPDPAADPLSDPPAEAPASAPPPPAPATDAGNGASLATVVAGINRAAAHYLLLVARSFVDLTYESVSIDPRSQDLVVSGLEIRPRLDWDPRRRCVVTVERAAIGGASGGPESVRSLTEIDGLRIPAACFDPGVGLMVQSFGFGTVEVSGAMLALTYDLPSSGADLSLRAAVTDAAEIRVAADFDYLWLRGIGEGDADEIEPVAVLSEAEITVENDGLWQQVGPMLGAQFGDLSNLPDIAGALLAQALAGPSGAPGPEAAALIANVTEELRRFVRDGDRLVLIMAPEDGVALDNGLFQTPQSMIEALAPRLSARPLAAERVIAPDTLAAALSGEGSLETSTRLMVAEALLDGVGAPKSATAGLSILEPLTAEWNARAAALSAEALLARGDAAAGYAMALRALTGAAPGALGLAERAEAALETGEILEIQARVREDWPEAGARTQAREAAEEAGDVAAMRRLAEAAATGEGEPRDYVGAYRLAVLAAAGGDGTAARLRDRLDARFETGAGADPAWADRRDAAAAAALSAWTEGGLGARVMETYAQP